MSHVLIRIRGKFLYLWSQWMIIFISCWIWFVNISVIIVISTSTCDIGLWLSCCSSALFWYQTMLVLYIELGSTPYTLDFRVVWEKLAITLLYMFGILNWYPGNFFSAFYHYSQLLFCIIVGCRDKNTSLGRNGNSHYFASLL